VQKTVKSDHRLGAVEVEIIKGALRAAQGEMEIVLERTAMSPFIREKKDFFAGIHAPNGRAIICTPIPFFGDLAAPVLQVYPISKMNPGDVYWYNDCYGSCGAVSHSSDQVLVSPIYFDGQVVGLTQSWAHFADIGGMRPGSMSPHTTDIFQEGLIVPPVKLIDRGVMNDDLIRLFECNSRFPQFIQGDLRAMIASVRLGGRRIEEMCARYGIDNLQAAFEEIIGQTERSIRQTALETFKPGTYTFSDVVDQDGLGNGPFKLVADLTSDGKNITIDLTRSSDQTPGPVNFLMASLVPKMMLGLFFSGTEPTLLINDGCETAIGEIKTRRGSIVDPIHPAPIGQRGITLVQLQSCLSGVINVANGGKGVAASSPYSLYYMRGKAPNGKQFLLTDGVAVGHGARSFADGHDAIYLVAQKNYPAEFLETAYPVRLHQYAINPNSGGPGQFRGGCGVIRDVEVLAESAMLSNRIGGEASAPWGVSGGHSARSGVVTINPGTPEARILPAMCDGTIIRKGDIVRLQTGGGGGWGHPFDRLAETVREDVLGGFVTASAAESDYGVVLIGEELTVDELATASQRKERGEVKLFHREKYFE